MLKTASPASMALVHSNGNYKVPPHIVLLNSKLLDVYAGRIKRLIISLPPQHGKSELVSKYFPVWYLGHRPNDQFVMATYSADYASEWGGKAKELFKDLAPSYFGLKPSKKGTDNKWGINNFTGGMRAVGARGMLTGKKANILLIDDPVKNDEEALSPTYRNKTWNWYIATAYPRLAPGGAVIIVMTRWHDDDLVGRILDSKTGKNFEVVNIPAIAEENDILGRLPGEALWSSQYSIEELRDKRDTLGEYWFSAEYQQKPIAGEYTIFKEEYWQYYDERVVIPYEFKVQTWDTAYEEGDNNAFSVCATWGIRDKCAYLIDIYEKRITFPDLEKQVTIQYNIHKPNLILIEDAASGKSLIPTIQKFTHLPVRGVQPMNKVVRAHAVSPFIEQGKVLLPANAIWKHSFIKQHSEFPFGKFKDQVDTTTITLQFLFDVLNDVPANTQTRTSTGDRSERRERKTRTKFSH